jgi:aminomethyltransferase
MEPIDLDSLQPHVRRGPLFERQRALGATFYEDYGRLWTASFGDPDGEYRAARTDAVIWDVSALSKWHLTGPDTEAALERLTTRTMADDAPGQVRYVLLLNDEGLLIEEGTRYVFGANDAWLIGNEDRPAMTDHVRGSVADLDVRIDDRTDQVVSIAVQGPRACQVLAPLVAGDLASLDYYRAIERTRVVDVEAMVSRTGFSGELGYELFLFGGAAAAGRVWDAIVAAGARPVGLDAAEMLRLEVGYVVADEDYVTGETDPVELGLDVFIDLNEGASFIGRDAVARRMTAPKRRLVTLSIDSEQLPDSHTPVTRKGSPVGEVRSVERTPRFGVIALAVLDADVAQDGMVVQVEGRSATVGPRPIDGEDRARRARPARP